MGVSSEKYDSKRAFPKKLRKNTLLLDTLTPALSQRREGERPAYRHSAIALPFTCRA
jgi:hypothetical protein